MRGEIPKYPCCLPRAPKKDCYNKTMIDPELKTELDQINQNLVQLIKKPTGSIWRSFLSGIMSALGYMVGLAIVVVLIGWFLQKSGLLPSVQEQIKTFSDLISAAKNLLPQTSTSTQSTAPSTRGGSGGETTVTLPNGQKINVTLPSGY